ncbi:MAG: alanine racemase [Clostridiales bacterium 38-18]|nr:MAG: alanine racemase [Clostridiales bacterium 38-18]
MNQSTRPVWAEINLDHLAHNISEVRRVTKKEALVTAVIKADGYGHGAIQIGQTLLNNGADRFAVATLSEALQLRSAFPSVEIMVLGYTPDELIHDAISARIIQTVYSLEQAIYFNRIAASMTATLKVHIKLDTGMRRIGFECNDAAIDAVVQIANLDRLELEGIYSHFAVADETDKTFTHLQASKFSKFIKQLEDNGVTIPIKHICNSAGIIDFPEYHFDMVRAGIMMYGLYPSDEVEISKVDLRQVMSLKARVSHVKMIEAGEGVSYGLKYVSDRPIQVATLPLGYADGYTRMLTGKAKGLISGELKPIIGRICMDQCMIEADQLSVTVGDVVTLFGKDECEALSIDQIAAWLGTINYEVVCMIGKRVPRHYHRKGNCEMVYDTILRQK